MRNFSIFVCAALLLGGRADAEQTAGEKAYTLTLMCQVVASYYHDQPAFEKSLDAAKKMGRAQGYAPKKVTDDLFTMTQVLGVENRDDPGAMEAHRANCRKIGLSS